MRTALLLPALCVAALVVGCGGSGDGGGGGQKQFAHSPDGVKACLDAVGYSDLGPVTADDLSSDLPAAKRRAVDAAVRGSTANLSATSGGPSQKGDTVSESPISHSELYFFAGPAKAKQAAAGLERVV